MRLELRQGCKVDVDLVSIRVPGFVTDTYFVNLARDVSNIICYVLTEQPVTSNNSELRKLERYGV